MICKALQKLMKILFHKNLEPYSIVQCRLCTVSVWDHVIYHCSVNNHGEICVIQCVAILQVQPSLHLSVFWEILFWKFIQRKSALSCYWPRLLGIIILSYLLASVQLTWQVENSWFLTFLMIFSWNTLIFS